MGLFDSFKRNNNRDGQDTVTLVENPVVQYEIQEPVERMVARTMLLDDRAHNFLGRIAEDQMFDGVLDVDEEWRCWIQGDTEGSCLFFDERLEVMDDEPYDHFLKYYSEEWKGISEELAAISKLGQNLNEYQIFKTALYNVFNNRNKLPFREYFEQVFSRAPDYHMSLERRSKEDLDFLVSFRPLEEVNRGGSYYVYDLLLEFNSNYSKDGYVYSVKGMDAYSADSMFSGPVEIPIYGRYDKFEESVKSYFLSENYSLFFYEAQKEHRTREKQKYNIPADYYEGTFIDVKKLVDFSDKSFQYGNSKIFIPKSQIAFAGEDHEKVYMKRWLFYKLKEPIEKINCQERKNENALLENTLADAKERSGQQDSVQDSSVVKQDDLVR